MIDRATCPGATVGAGALTVTCNVWGGGEGQRKRMRERENRDDRQSYLPWSYCGSWSTDGNLHVCVGGGGGGEGQRKRMREREK